MAKQTEKLSELHTTNDLGALYGITDLASPRDFYLRALKPGADFDILNYRGNLLAHMSQLHHGEPSDAMFRAFVTVPMKLMAPNVEHESLPFDMEELKQLIDKEKA